MTTARSDLMPPGQSGTFHIVARCVRRSFLWGIDTYTDQNYDHRKTWVEQRILLLSNAFAIVELCGDVKPPASGDCESTSSSNGVVGS